MAICWSWNLLVSCQDNSLRVVWLLFFSPLCKMRHDFSGVREDGAGEEEITCFRRKKLN